MPNRPKRPGKGQQFSSGGSGNGRPGFLQSLLVGDIEPGIDISEEEIDTGTPISDVPEDEKGYYEQGNKKVRMPMAVVQGEKPGFFKNFVTKGEAGRNFAAATNAVQMQNLGVRQSIAQGAFERGESQAFNRERDLTNFNQNKELGEFNRKGQQVTQLAVDAETRKRNAAEVRESNIALSKANMASVDPNGNWMTTMTDDDHANLGVRIAAKAKVMKLNREGQEEEEKYWTAKTPTGADAIRRGTIAGWEQPAVAANSMRASTVSGIDANRRANETHESFAGQGALNSLQLPGGNMLFAPGRDPRKMGMIFGATPAIPASEDRSDPSRPRMRPGIPAKTVLLAEPTGVSEKDLPDVDESENTKPAPEERKPYSVPAVIDSVSEYRKAQQDKKKIEEDKKKRAERKTFSGLK